MKTLIGIAILAVLASVATGCTNMEASHKNAVEDRQQELRAEQANQDAQEIAADMAAYHTKHPNAGDQKNCQSDGDIWHTATDICTHAITPARSASSR